MRTVYFASLLFFSSVCVNGQGGGGNALFSFVTLPSTPQLSALGGINIAHQSRDIGMSFHNPALLRPEMHGQAQFVFHSYLGGIQALHTQWGMHSRTAGTTFSLGIQYLDYGKIAQTDASGNVLGLTRPVDQLIQLSASRPYLTRWHYGASFKWLHSAYGMYRASGLALDIGITYADSTNGWQMALTLGNMGAAVKKFQGADAGDLPFDTRIGIAKKLKHAPIQFAVNWHHLHQFTLLQDVPAQTVSTPLKTYGWADQLLSHLTVSTQVLVGQQLELSLGYNFLRRFELNAGTAANGANGLSYGLGVLLKRWQLRYARAMYMSGRPTQMVGISMKVFK